MNKRIYRGIPYLGEDTPNMYKRIRNNIRFKTIHTTFYDMWYNLEPNRYLAIVDKQWLTWLDDIIFNYRDNKIMLPYYKYKYFDVILTPKKLDGNLIYNNGVLTITHSYNLCFKEFLFRKNRYRIKRKKIRSSCFWSRSREKCGTNYQRI